MQEHGVFTLDGIKKGELNLDCAVGNLARRRKPKRNEKLKRFCAEDIFIERCPHDTGHEVGGGL